MTWKEQTWPITKLSFWAPVCLLAFWVGAFGGYGLGKKLMPLNRIDESTSFSGSDFVPSTTKYWRSAPPPARSDWKATTTKSDSDHWRGITVTESLRDDR